MTGVYRCTEEMVALSWVTAIMASAVESRIRPRLMANLEAFRKPHGMSRSLLLRM